MSIKEEDIMYSYCTYIAENAESLNLVEGEKVYVLGKHEIRGLIFTIISYFLSGMNKTRIYLLNCTLIY